MNQVRADISDKLIHFTSGDNLEDAFGNLCSIIDDRRLLGSGNKIKGGYKCICFTEAPLASLGGGLVNPSAYSCHSPFGIIVEKAWLFAIGGRPAIYQSDWDYESLPEDVRWRHVRYEPCANPPIDFTWEREWRVLADSVTLRPGHSGIVVPEAKWAHHLIDAHTEQQDWQVWEYSTFVGESLAELYREEFQWNVLTLVAG